VALAAGACAALAAAALDAGLAAALVLPGVAAALVLAARDACWSTRDLGALGAYRARHAPVATAHALLVAAAAAPAIALALVDTGDEPGRALTSAALHAPLLVAALIAPAALVIGRRAGARAAAPWAAAALAALLAWGARGAAVDAVLASDTQAARRI